MIGSSNRHDHCNTGGARILNAGEDLVALAEREGDVGDRNGDGDVLDMVLAFYDPAGGVLVSSGLALPTFHGFVGRPIHHRGRWAVYVDELAQGLGDLDGDGVLAGSLLFVYDPATGRSRIPAVEPFVQSNRKPVRTCSGCTIRTRIDSRASDGRARARSPSVTSSSSG